MLDWLKRRLYETLALGFGQRGSRAQLLDLPQELLDLVIDYLDISEVASLSICTKDLYRSVGKDQRPLLRLGDGHESQRQQFLLRLARDNSSLFFCYICSCLHLVSSIGLPRRCLGQLRPACIGRCEQSDIPGQSFETYGGNSSYRLTFPHVQLVMARHHQGDDYGKCISSLSARMIQKHLKYDVWTLLNVEPNIIANDLFLRVQHWIIFDENNHPTFERLSGPSLCSHVTKYVGPTTSDLLLCQKQHLGERSECPSCSMLYRCPECSMEFESDAFCLEDGRVAVIITKWLNLGGDICTRRSKHGRWLRLRNGVA